MARKILITGAEGQLGISLQRKFRDKFDIYPTDNITSESGGPFFVYIFETDSVNEVILVSGFVNYPGNEKLLLLKQLEIIANTLHKGDA